MSEDYRIEAILIEKYKHRLQYPLIGAGYNFSILMVVILQGFIQIRS